MWLRRLLVATLAVAARLTSALAFPPPMAMMSTTSARRCDLSLDGFPDHEAWGLRGFSVFDKDMTDLVDVNGSRALRVAFPKGSGAHGSRGGTTFHAAPDACFPALDVALAYDIFFPADFPWSRGGKMPGVFVGTGPAAGGEHGARSASARLVWRDRGRINAYLYLPTGVDQHPEYHREVSNSYATQFGHVVFDKDDLHALPGRWNRVKVRVRLNEPGDDDGYLAVTVNAKTVAFDRLVWRTSRDVDISKVSFSMFFGGTWTAPADTYAALRNISVLRHS